MFSRTITFTGQGPANAVIQIRQGETIIGTTTTMTQEALPGAGTLVLRKDFCF